MIQWAMRNGAKLRQFFIELSLFRKILLVASSLAVLLVSTVFILFVMVWFGWLGPLPDETDLRDIQHPIASEVYSADSVLLGKYFLQDRSTASIDDIPSSLRDALIATEDARFYEHNGIDYRSLARVMIKGILLRQESAGGGSTLTQQLAKNLYARQSYVLFSLVINKMREMIIARRIESVYSKDEILVLYLNTVPFGDNTFGVRAAAQRFFSVPVHSLTTDQSAVLVGMLKATYSYNPRLFPERAVQRRNVVLSQMKKYQYLDEAVTDSLQGLPLQLNYHRYSHDEGLAPYFRAYIKSSLAEWCKQHTRPDGKPYNLYTDGLKIYTTIHSDMQRYAEEAVRDHLTTLQREFTQHWKGRQPWGNNSSVLEQAIRQSFTYRRLKKEGLSEEEIKAEMEKPVKMTVFSWEGDKDVTMSPVDSVQYYLKFLHAGVLAVSPHDGRVMAWVGGINHNFFQYDHVRESTRRQAGSTFKPIVYAAALEQGMKPCDYISASKTVFTNMDNWQPENTKEDYDRKYSMEGGLTYSVNTVSIKVAERAGLSNIISLARKMGITSPLPEVPSIALGTPSVSVMEMVTAYSAFANRGVPVKPYTITTITNARDSVLATFAVNSGDPAMSEATAELMTQMLRRVVDEGTASGLRSKYRLTGDIAGKTGTTQANADGWFMAITPDLVVGTWVGADNPAIHFRTTSLGQGAHTALPIFAGLYRKMDRDHELKAFTRSRFPAPSARTRRLLNCVMEKSDQTFFEKVFGKKDEGVVEREYGKEEKKRGFFDKLFNRKKD